MRLVAHASLVLPVALSFACASTMSVTTTPPGADVTVDGRPVGKSPVSTEVPSGGPPVVVKAKLNGKEATKTVNRDATNWGIVGAGAGAGVGTLCAGWACSVGLGLAGLGFLGIPVGCIGCASVVGMPVGAYFMWGGKPPDQVTLDIAGAPAASSAAPPAPSDAPVEPMAPSDGAPPPPPPEPLPY